MRLRTVGKFNLVLDSCCAVCILRKLGLTWVVRRPGTYHSTLAELSVVHQSCSMWRIFSSFLACPQHQIAAPPFFVHRSQWTFERELYMLSEGFPFSHQISTIPIKFRDYLRQYPFCCSSVYLSGFIWVLFIRMLLDWNTSHFWHHVISLCGRTYQTEDVLFSNDHPCSSSNISITWVISLASSV